MAIPPVVSPGTTPVSIPSGDTLLIAPSGAIVSSIAYAAYSASSPNTTLIVHGFLGAVAGTGFLVDAALEAASNVTVIVGEGGIISGGRNYVAVVMAGTSDNAFDNAGEVIGGGGLLASGWANETIRNSGTITGARFHGLRIENSTAPEVLNSGTISGVGGIELANTSARIVNTGTIESISATVDAVDGTFVGAGGVVGTVGFTLRNLGTVTAPVSAVSGSVGNDFVTNAGTINGSVGLANGNDTYLGGRGMLVGSVFGNAGNDLIVGGAGDETLLGNEGRDTIRGGAGDDVIDPGTWSDSVHGGAGDDTITDGDGFDTLDGGTGDDSISAGALEDSLRGGAGDDTALGGDGLDRLFGGTGDDSLDGGGWGDTIEGGAGEDTLRGGQGWDVLAGGKGDDLLDGGTEPDTFVFAPGGGRDRVTAFADGQDKVNLADFDLTDYADLLATHSVTNVAGGVLIAFDTGDTLTLQGIALAQLSGADFQF